MTWMRLPIEFQKDDSYFNIIPIEYENNPTFGTGAKNGSKEIIKASEHLEYYDEQFEVEAFIEGIKVLEPIKAEEFTQLKSQLDKIIPNLKFPIFLGGDHAITIASVKSLEQVNEEFAVIVFDAHSDFRDQWNNSAFNHACTSKQISKNHNTAIIGVRSQDIDETKEIKNSKNIQVLYAWNCSKEKFLECLSKLKSKVYISIDVDVFDPSFIRNTGTPEPGGLDWNILIELLKIIFETKSVIGADIVEFAPTENFQSEAYALAKLAYKLMSLQTKSIYS